VPGVVIRGIAVGLRVGGPVGVDRQRADDRVRVRRLVLFPRAHRRDTSAAAPPATAWVLAAWVSTALAVLGAAAGASS
jgi:hypothetical protein